MRPDTRNALDRLRQIAGDGLEENYDRIDALDQLVGLLAAELEYMTPAQPPAPERGGAEGEDEVMPPAKVAEIAAMVGCAARGELRYPDSYDSFAAKVLPALLASHRALARRVREVTSREVSLATEHATALQEIARLRDLLGEAEDVLDRERPKGDLADRIAEVLRPVCEVLDGPLRTPCSGTAKYRIGTHGSLICESCAAQMKTAVEGDLVALRPLTGGGPR